MSSDRELLAVPEVLDRAAALGGAEREAVCNVVVAADGLDPGAVELTNGSYSGPGAGPVGRLAAAVRAVDATDAGLQYPTPDHVADGPWLVLAPLSGAISTVHCGAGRVTVRAAVDHGGTDPAVGRRLSELLAAARPSHPRYPVEDDRRGVFTTGLTTYSLASVDVEGETMVATFDVTTTPATGPAEIRSTFEALDGVTDVAYEPIVGVERADPSPRLRDAVEAAHRTVLGDARYEWVPEPTVFSRIPGPEKVALGTGTPGQRSFDSEAYSRCVDLLVESIDAIGGPR